MLSNLWHLNKQTTEIRSASDKSYIKIIYNKGSKARIVLLVDLREIFFRYRVGDEKGL